MSGDTVSLARDLPTEPRQLVFRITVLTLASVVGIYCVWLLLAEVLRPGVIGLPVDPQNAAVAVQKRERANWAARVGLIRGDLWAEAGYTSAELLWKSPSGGKDASEALDLARVQLDRAIRYAPTEA